MLDYLREVVVFIITAHQAGYNMIPQIAYRNYIESWSRNKA